MSNVRDCPDRSPTSGTGSDSACAGAATARSSSTPTANAGVPQPAGGEAKACVPRAARSGPSAPRTPWHPRAVRRLGRFQRERSGCGCWPSAGRTCADRHHGPSTLSGWRRARAAPHSRGAARTAGTRGLTPPDARHHRPTPVPDGAPRRWPAALQPHRWTCKPPYERLRPAAPVVRRRATGHSPSTCTECQPGGAVGVRRRGALGLRLARRCRWPAPSACARRASPSTVAPLPPGVDRRHARPASPSAHAPVVDPDLDLADAAVLRPGHPGDRDRARRRGRRRRAACRSATRS